MRMVPLSVLLTTLLQATQEDDMRPHFPVAEADRQIVFYVNDCAESYFEGGGTYRECGPTVRELAAHLGFDVREIVAAVVRLSEQGYLTLEDGRPITDRTVIYPTPSTLVVSPSFEAMSQTEVDAFIRRLRED
jgi:hypothetical protein